MSHLKQSEFIGGAKLFAMQIVGNFNKIPVQRITDGVVAALVDDDKLDLHEFNFLKRFSRAASDRGSMIIQNKRILPGDVLHVEVEDEITTAYQFIELNGNFWLKVWLQTGGLTTVTTFNGIQPEKKYVESLEVLKADVEKFTIVDAVDIEGTVVIVENGNGILIPATETILRFAELTGLMAATANEDATEWAVPGYVGNIRKLNQSIGKYIPVPPETIFQSLANPALSDMIFKEMALILPFYFQTTSSYTLMPRESGIARYLNMQGYLNRVKLTQRLAKFVMKELFGVTMTFNNLLLDLTLEQAEGNTGGSIGSIATESQDVV